MASANVPVTPGSGANVQTFHNTVGGTAVDAEGTVQVDIDGIPLTTRQVPVNDLFGEVTMSGRMAQLFANFGQGSAAAQTTATTSGAATVATTSNLAVLTVTAASIGDAKIASPGSVLYSGQSEVYGAFAALFAVTNASTQFARCGLFNATDGFYFGYGPSGAFGIGSRVGSTDTLVAQASWNVDTLTSATNSKFTAGGTPTTLVQADLNLYRIRYGGLGISQVFFEVMSPDGVWVTVHILRALNSQVGALVSNPNLPLAAEASNTAASGAAVTLSVGGWVAGVAGPGVDDNTSFGALGALNAAVTVSLEGLRSVGFQLAAGTLIGTIVPEVSFDQGATWNTGLFDISTKVASIVFGTSNTATAGTIIGEGGSCLARIRVSAYTSGTANCTLRATSIGDPSNEYSAPTNGVLPPATVLIGGSDGTNIQAINTNAVAAKKVLLTQNAENTRATYSTIVTVVPQTTGASDLVTIYGSGSKIIRVVHVTFSMTSTTADDFPVQLIKRSTSNTGGTSSVPAATPHDSANATATAVLNSYTANPSALGTTVGSGIRAAKYSAFTPSTPTIAPTIIDWPLGQNGEQPPTLRLSTDGLAINLNSANGTGGSATITITWTEDAT